MEEYQFFVRAYPELDYWKDGDLKASQRCWTFHYARKYLPEAGRFLDVGGSRCELARVLSRLGYEVWVVDPYDGCGGGTTNFTRVRWKNPRIKFVRGYMGEDAPLPESYFDMVSSTSVLEHMSADRHEAIWNQYLRVLRDGGIALDSVDMCVRGVGSTEGHRHVLNAILRSRGFKEDYEILAQRALEDVDTFYMSPHCHLRWRRKLRYEEYPYKYVTSLNLTRQITK